MKRNRLLRGAVLPLALAGLTATALLTGCGSGLLDTEDEALTASLSLAIDSSSATLMDVGYGDVVDVSMTIKMTNANFADAFKEVLDEEAPTSSKGYELLDEGFFELALIDSNGKDVSNLIEASSLKATSKITQSRSSFTDSTFNRASASFSAALTVEIAESTSNDDKSAGKLVIRSTQATGRKGLSASTAYSFSVIQSDWGFVTPTVGQQIAAAANREDAATVGVTLINLPTGTRVDRDITAGTEIGTLGSSTIRALTKVSKKARQIPVLLESDTTTFEAGTAELNAYYVTGGVSQAIGSEDLANVIIPYYGEDYSTYTTSNATNLVQYTNNSGNLTDYEFELSGTAITSTGVNTTPIGFASWIKPALTKGALVFDASTQSGPRGGFTYDGDALWTNGDTGTGISYADGVTYYVEFDITVGAGSNLYVYNTAVVANDKYGKKPSKVNPTEDTGLYLGNYADAAWGTKLENYLWGIDNTTAGTYHYKLEIAYNAEAGASTITPYIDGVAGTPVHDIGGGDAQGIAINTARGTTTTLDNIIVYRLVQ